MGIGWLESLLYGLLSGFTEFVPVSAQAHSALLRRMFGVEDLHFLDLFVHLAVLISVFVALRSRIRHLRREQKLAGTQKRYRRHQPDLMALMDLRLLKTAAVPMLLCFLVYPVTYELGNRFLLMAGLLILNGVILYYPRMMPAGNKDARMLTPFDGVLLGVSSALGILPGISRVGACMSAAQLRGADRRFALDTALLLSIPALLALIVVDLLWLILAGFAGITFLVVLQAILAAAAAGLGGHFGILLLRFLSVKAGFSTFAYYCWGAALFVFILFLII